MRANKLETALSRDRLACLAPPDMVFFSCRCTPVGMGVFGGFIAPAQPATGGFFNQGPCPVYCSRRGRHYVGNDVVDESH